MKLARIFVQVTFLFASMAISSSSKGYLHTREYVGVFGDIVSSYQGVLPKDGVLEEVSIYPQKQDGSSERIARKGFVVRYPNAIGTVVIVHGFMCDKYDVGMLRKIFKPGLYNVMTFDLRAHGEDIDNQYCTFGKDESLDVACAVEFIRNHPYITSDKVCAYAFSMGTSATIEAQAKNNNLFDALVLDCPPDSSENMIKRGLENLRFSLLGYDFAIPGYTALQEYAFHPYVQELVKKVLRSVSKLDTKNVATNIQPVSPFKSMRSINVPCFFIHCKNDEKVPLEAVMHVYNAARGPKQLWITKGRHHFDSYFYNPEKYIGKVRTFLSHVFEHENKSIPYDEIIDDTK